MQLRFHPDDPLFGVLEDPETNTKLGFRFPREDHRDIVSTPAPSLPSPLQASIVLVLHEVLEKLIGAPQQFQPSWLSVALPNS